MKQRISILSLLLLTLFAACRKNPTVPQQGPGTPGDPATQRTFRLVFQNPAGQNTVLDNLTAYITLTNHRNEAVYTNKAVAIQYDQQYRSAVFTLAKGNYKLTGFFVKQGDTVVKFASPVAGSAKAGLVQHPLSNAIVLDEQTEKQIEVEVLSVGRREHPQSFGYPEGSFGPIPGDDQQDPGPQDKRIFVRPLIKIGDIVYDSIPVSLVLRSWDAQNNMQYNAFSLPAGTQAIYLPKNAVRYQLSISKWGTYDELLLNYSDVQENTLYILGGNKPAKTLKSVLDYKMVNGSTTPLTKTEYEYAAPGIINMVKVWGKRADNSNYVQERREFAYENGNIREIKVFNEHNTLLRTSSFEYDATKKVTAMEEVAGTQRTRAAVHYLPLEGSTGISNDHKVEINLDHDHLTYKTYYNKTIRGGTAIADRLTTSHGNMIEGLFDFDTQINPYAHLRIPDLFLSNYSKHNVKTQWLYYTNTFPEVEAYSLAYTYDADGYPTQLLTKYRSYLTKVDAYTIKTTFVY
jgi:hypothetical protein